MGAAVLLGWALDVPALKSVLPGLVTMKVNTALCLLLGSAALLLVTRDTIAPPTRLAVKGIATFIVVLAILTLCEDLFRFNLGIDQWLFPDPPNAIYFSSPGRMSPSSAFCFLLLGTTLFATLRLNRNPNWQPLILGNGVTLIVTGSMALIGYVTDGFFHAHWWNYSGMAVHTAAGFVLLGAGLLALARSRRRLNWSLDSLTGSGFVISLASLLVISGTSYHFTSQFRDDAFGLNHTQDVLNAIERTRSVVNDLESTQRGFLLFGEEQLVAGRQTLQGTARERMGDLRRLTLDNPRQQTRLDQLGVLVDHRVEWEEQIIKKRREEGVDPARKMAASGAGLALTSGIHQVLEAMNTDEYALLEERRLEAGASATTTFLLLPLSVFVSLTLFSLGLFFLNARVAERAQVESALRQSEASLVAAQSRAKIGNWELDARTREVRWSAEMFRIFGRDPALGPPQFQEILQIIHPDDREAFAKANAEALAERREHGIDFRVVWPDHSIRWIEGRGDIALDADGQPLRLFGTAQDITERALAEAASRESEARFRTMANSMSQLAWIARADGFIFWYNRRWYEYTGTTPEQMEGWGWQSVHAPQALPEVMAQWKEAITAGKVFEMEFPLRGGDGKFRRFLTRAEPFKDSAGKVVQWFGTNTDVDELKRVEETLRGSEASLAAAQFRAKIGSWELDLATQAWTWSAEMYRLFNRDPARGTPSFNEFVASIYAEDRDPFAHRFNECLAAGHPHEQDFRVPGDDGGIRWIQARGELIVDATKQPVRMIGTSQDITERKLAEDEVSRLNTELEQRVIERTAQLEAANKELEAFSYSVSHDLRAPLRAMDGFSQAVLEDYASLLPAEGQRYLLQVRDGAQRMGQLVDDLLTFSRLSRTPLNRQPVEMTALVEEVLADLAVERAGREVEVHVAKLGEWHCDRTLLKQVWVNLISNALKYTRKREQARIDIDCTCHAEECIFRVQDNGAGFDMRYSNKLFGVFQRLHRAEDYEGTGVGLAIIQRLIHRHGGRVWAEAELDRGATFYFTLPVKEEPAA